MMNLRISFAAAFILILNTFTGFCQNYMTDSVNAYKVLTSAGHSNPDITKYTIRDSVSGRIIALTIPGVYENRSPVVDDGLLNMTELRSLTLDRINGTIGFNALPTEIGYLTKLETLVLYSQSISDLPASLEKIRSLKHVDIVFNKFDHFPKVLADKCSSLTYLRLSNNSIDSLPEVSGLPDTFIVNNCRISHIPESYASLEPPSYSDFRGNGLCNLSSQLQEWLSSANPTWASNQYCKPPVITLKGPNPFFMIINNPYIEPGYVVTDDFDKTPTVVIDTSLNTAVEGSYTIIYKAEDSHGHSTSCTRTIIVMEKDTTTPVVTLIGADTIRIEKFQPYLEHGARVSDLFDGNVAYTITGKVDSTTIGTYELLYSATDSAENTGVAKRIVHVVEDTTPPVLTLNGKLIDTITASGSFYESGWKATDGNLDLTALVKIDYSDFDSSVPGTYYIVYSVTDYNELTTTTKREITVINDYVHKNIMVNQIGYYCDLPKTVTLVSPFQLDSFFVRDNNKAIVFRGALKKVGTNYIGDFTVLEKAGTYHVWIPALGRSCSFEIGNNIYADALRASLKAFYYQRSSIPIEEKYAGKWNRKAGHPDTSLLMHNSTGKSGKYSSPGGWYDAGDYGKYIVNGGISVNTLMLLYEACPDIIDDKTLNIPETGNGKSDLLDEIKFELDWFKTMQDSDGGAFFKIGPMKFPDFIMPDKDTAQRYVIGKSTSSTLNLAAVMAQAGRVFRSYDNAYAEDCIERAKRAWKWAEDNPSVPYPYVGGGTGLYDDGGFGDEKLWAATELWVTTGDAIYGDYCLPLFGTNTYPFSTWRDVENQHLFPIMFKKEKYATDFDSKVKGFKDYIRSVKMYQFSDDFNILKWATFWGSNSCRLNTIISLLACYSWTSDTFYINSAARAIDYIFGRNEYSKCFVTGFGYNPPRFPHHRISGADGIDDPIPGFVVGGPNDQHNDDDVVSYPTGIHYLDDQESYASNEVAINWNAPLVFVLGYLESLNADSPVRTKWSPKNSLPEILSLTPVRKGIHYGVIINGIPSTVNTLKVNLFSLNGKCVSSQYLNNVKKNTQVLFDTRKLAGQVYLMSIDGEGISMKRKLMFLR